MQTSGYNTTHTATLLADVDKSTLNRNAYFDH